MLDLYRDICAAQGWRLRDAEEGSPNMGLSLKDPAMPYSIPVSALQLPGYVTAAARSYTPDEHVTRLVTMAYAYSGVDEERAYPDIAKALADGKAIKAKLDKLAETLAAADTAMTAAAEEWYTANIDLIEGATEQEEKK